MRTMSELLDLLPDSLSGRRAGTWKSWITEHLWPKEGRTPTDTSILRDAIIHWRTWLENLADADHRASWVLANTHEL